MTIDDLLPGDGRWDVRLQPLDPPRGLYSIVLHDPETWATAGPYQLAFATVDDAFNWLCQFADVDTGRWSMGHLHRGLHVQGQAHAPLWRAILSALEHCSHLAQGAADRPVGSEPSLSHLTASSGARLEGLPERTKDSKEIFHMGVAESVDGRMDPFAFGIVETDTWPIDGERTVEVAYLRRLMEEPVIVTLTGPVSGDEATDDVTIRTEDFGTMTLRRPEPHDAAWLSRYPDIPHDESTLTLLISALDDYETATGEPFDPEESEAVEHLTASAGPGSRHVSTVQYHLGGSERLAASKERNHGTWSEVSAPVGEETSFAVQPYAAQALISLFDEPGIAVHRGFAELADREEDEEIAFDDLPGLFAEYVMRLADEIEAGGGALDVAGVSSWLEFVRHGSPMSIAAMYATTARMVRALRLAGHVPSISPPVFPEVEAVVSPAAPQSRVEGEALPMNPTPTRVTELLASSASARRDEGWTRLTEFVAALVALTDDLVVVSVDTRQYTDGDAYVQLCREDGGALTLEAVSSGFLDPPLPLDAVNSLHELGWEDPPGDGLPNYLRYLEPVDTAPGDVAAFLVETLRVAYGAEPGDRYQFAPGPLVDALLRGDFGPRFMLDPDMPEARKARHYLGIRFPGDLAR